MMKVFRSWKARQNADRITQLCRQLDVALRSASTDPTYEPSTRQHFTIAAHDLEKVRGEIRQALFPASRSGGVTAQTVAATAPPS